MKLIKNQKKLVLVFMFFVSLIPNSAYAEQTSIQVDNQKKHFSNPYDLFGKGNCAYFAWDMMDLFWPVTFEVPGAYDAKDWVDLVGSKVTQNGKMYKLIKDKTPQVGDIVVFSDKDIGFSRGHVAFVTGINQNCSFDVKNKDFKTDIDIQVMESANYASNYNFPNMYEKCLYRSYRYSVMQGDKIVYPDMCFLRWKVVVGYQVNNGM
ncbi:CHAP domain-containing protein [Desulfotomaculum arcticum]|uniref:CHAP domain-containing protein n=1 Tax=Desulfotruncus arcticus DSM 17038 TaxID=1121424 RepID=A0A1I2Z8B3_9FIRM|nr:CHAP domain-containing protein [Desulfotruncus arcticus]SFH33815.1 CHAP domain-containing protein [Desulfotomaculum arcticum] [Desulfotruncus arcticus DSM 17038]